MPLPIAGTTWPPPEWEPVFEQYELNSALYEGDVTGLHTIFVGAGPAGSAVRGDGSEYHYNTTQRRRTGIRGLIDSIRSWFWGSPNPAGQARSRLHSPLAGNLATLSADTLMADPPAYRFIGADGNPLRDNPAQTRLDDLLNDDQTRATLMQAAEYAAGLSAVALTVGWNTDALATDPDAKPWINAIACDGVVPAWVGEQLVSVTLWTTHPNLDAAGAATGVYYHLEVHEVGQITHALYLGTETSLGSIVPLDRIPATAHIPLIPGGVVGTDEQGFTVILPTGIDRLTAAWWRNLPTRRFRRYGVMARCGRADTEGVEHFLDQVDMAWSSWMRDIKLARARLIVSDAALDGGTIDAPTFDDDAEILRALPFAAVNPDDPPLEAHQFAIRAAEHEASILALTKEILNHAGYSLSSYGEYGDVQKTATEVTDRTSATERTRTKKALYYRQAAVPLILALLEIDRVHYRQPGMPANVTLDIRFSTQESIDPKTLAQTLTFLRAANVASTKTLVTMLHPEWDADEIDDEVDAIMEEKDAAMQQELDAGLALRDADAEARDKRAEERDADDDGGDDGERSKSKQEAAA